MEKFNPETDSNLIANYNDPKHFEDVYNIIAEKMTSLEDEHNNRYEGQGYEKFQAKKYITFNAQGNHIYIDIAGYNPPIQGWDILKMKMDLIAKEYEEKPQISYKK